MSSKVPRRALWVSSAAKFLAELLWVDCHSQQQISLCKFFNEFEGTNIRYVSAVINPISLGTVPVSSFPHKLRFSRAVSSPISQGILPPIPQRVCPNSLMLLSAFLIFSQQSPQVPKRKSKFSFTSSAKFSSPDGLARLCVLEILLSENLKSDFSPKYGGR